MQPALLFLFPGGRLTVHPPGADPRSAGRRGADGAYSYPDDALAAAVALPAFNVSEADSEALVWELAIGLYQSQQPLKALAEAGGVPDTLTLTLNTSLTVLHNSSSPHALPCFLAEVAKAEYRLRSGRPAARYSTTLHPLPLTSREEVFVQTILSNGPLTAL